MATRVPVWQPDGDVPECPICLSSFSVFYRRHHCRKCGRVVCSACSKRMICYLATTYVVSPPGQLYLESPLVPHRTCDDCVLEMDRINRALEPVAEGMREFLVQDVPYMEEELQRCPICSRLLTNLPPQEQESHVNDCLSSPRNITGGSYPNRLLIYRLPSKEAFALGECSMCFEDFLPGQNVGRLECLCLFHEPCIMGWFTRKGAGRCPVHNQ